MVQRSAASLVNKNKNKNVVPNDGGFTMHTYNIVSGFETHLLSTSISSDYLPRLDTSFTVRHIISPRLDVSLSRSLRIVPAETGIRFLHYIIDL